MEHAAEVRVTGEDDVAFFAASLARDPDGIDLPYLVLDHVVTRYDLRDATLVLRPDPLGRQIFRRGRVPASADEAAALASLPIGLYTEPDTVGATVRAALAGICNLALAAQAVRHSGAIDPATGLSSRSTIEAALARATACGARYGWAFTAVLLATAGEGTAEERWSALSAALRAAMRAGDEAGVAGHDRALAILGNAGPDVVHPFVARVRSALSTAGATGVDLHAATVSCPAETVDPEAMWSLLTERLEQLVASVGIDGHERRTEPAAERRPSVVPGALELALRSLQGVVSVGLSAHPSGVGTQLTVVTVPGDDGVAVAGQEAVAARLAREHRIDAPVAVVAATGTGHTGAAPLPGSAPIVGMAAVATVDGNGRGNAIPVPAPLPVAPVGGHAPAPTSLAAAVPGTGTVSPHQVSATGWEPAAAPGRGEAEPAEGAEPPEGAEAEHRGEGAEHHGGTPPGTGVGTGNRVSLVRATFDRATGTAEVELSRSGASGLGRASVGPLAGGAQATLAALEDLGLDVPYYLVSAERAHTVPGEPVVVVLAPRRHSISSTPGALPPMAERIGLAGGEDEVVTASRATLGALNRFLTSAVVAR